MGVKIKVFLIVVAVVLLGLVFYFGVYNNFLNKRVASGSPSPMVNIDYSNFASIMSSSTLVKDLPRNSDILVGFYSLDGGSRTIERSYSVRDGVLVESGLESAEVVILLHSRYLDELNTHNFCSVLKGARQNGELVIESSLSNAALLWKFKGMTKHRDCIF